MAGSPGKRKQGNRALRIKTMQKYGAGRNNSDHMEDGGNATTGKTLEIKAMPHHPGLDHVAPHGTSKAHKNVDDRKMVLAHTKHKPKPGKTT